MQIPLDQFDLSVYDSADINLGTPDWLLSRLLLVIEALTDNSPNALPEEHTEIKLRAVLNSLVHAGLKQKAWTKSQLEQSIMVSLPKLAEIYIDRKSGLDLIRMQNQLVILAPSLEGSASIGRLLSWLSNLIDESHGARTWILDLSLVSHVPFELLGYLIGLKHSLDRLQIGLDLMWLRQEAVPPELLDSVQKNFSLFKRGAFLLSR